MVLFAAKVPGRRPRGRLTDPRECSSVWRACFTHVKLVSFARSVAIYAEAASTSKRATRTTTRR